MEHLLYFRWNGLFSYRDFPRYNKMLVYSLKTIDTKFMIEETVGREIILFISKVNRFTFEDIFYLINKRYNRGVSKSQIYEDLKEFIENLASLEVIVPLNSSTDKENTNKSNNFTPRLDKIDNSYVLKFFSEKLIPYQVNYEVTPRCNQRCIHCYVAPYNSIKHSFREPCITDDCSICNFGKLCINRKSINYQQEIPLSIIKNSLEELKEMGTVELVFTGGEPFMRKDMIDIIKFARKLNFVIIVLSNGTLISSEVIDELIINDVSVVKVTLFGSTGELHDAHTKVPGSFKRVVRFLELAKDKGLDTFVQVILTKYNYNDFLNILNLLNSLGTQYSHTSYITPDISGSKEPLQHHLTNEQLREYLYWIYKNDPPESESGAISMCAAGKRLFAIDAFGYVIPCLNLRLKAGNIYDDSLENIWNNSNVFKWLRKIEASNFEDCLKCDVKDYCLFGRCPGKALLEKKDMFSGYYNVCKYAKLYKTVVEEGNGYKD